MAHMGTGEYRVFTATHRGSIITGLISTALLVDEPAENWFPALATDIEDHGLVTIDGPGADFVPDGLIEAAGF